MGGVNDRGGKPTKKFDSTELARLTKPTAPELDDADEAFREWNEEAEGTPHAAHGTPHAHARPLQQPTIQSPASRVAAGTSPPGDLTRSRTATVHDPFTTGLLAEVARRTQTAELSPDQIRNAETDDDETEEDDVDKTPPVVRPRR